MIKMPVDTRTVLQLSILLLAVPVQYFLTQYMSTTPSQRSVALKSVVTSATSITANLLSWTSWKEWCSGILNNFGNFSPVLPEDDRGECPAIEVIKFDDPDGYFAGSSEVRSPRPKEVMYRVGQVIRHKKWGYRGVIVGWDATARAPEFWFKQMHPSDKPHWRTQPNYSILVDTRDRQAPQLTYVPQENLEIITNSKIYHPNVDEYFEAHDGAQYLPRPYLKALYPHD